MSFTNFEAAVVRSIGNEAHVRRTSLDVAYGPSEMFGESLEIVAENGLDRQYFHRVDPELRKLLAAGPVKIADGLTVELTQCDLATVEPRGRGSSAWRAMASQPGAQKLPRLTNGWRKAIRMAREGA